MRNCIAVCVQVAWMAQALRFRHGRLHLLLEQVENRCFF